MLSKSDYIRGLQSLRLLWLYKNDKSVLPELSETDKKRMQQGYEVEEYAKELFPGIINLSKLSFKEQIEKTKQHLNSQKPLFQASFLHEDLYSRGDILVPVPGKEGNVWDIVEVKSSTRPKKLHLDDLAFQKHVYESFGLRIRKCFILHVNNKYVKHGKINPKEFLVKTDVTNEVNELDSKYEDNIEERIENMIKCIHGECPDFSVEDLNTLEYDTFLKDGFIDSLPKNNIFHLVRFYMKNAVDLFNKGIVKMEDLPESVKLNEKQKIQKTLAKNGGMHADKEKIKEFLDNLKYPIYYFDFETIFPAVPKFDNSRPYQHIPFQFSLHIQEKPNGKLKHVSFLAEGKNDPRPKLIEALEKHLGKKGDILVYNQRFEKKVLKELAKFFPLYKELIEENFLPRIKDLMKPFSDFHYYNPKQKGSVSIKKVLPLFSDLSYDGLNIRQGDVASLEFERVTYTDSVSEKERKQVREALEKYCELDTLAEVEIVKALREIVI